MNAPSVGRSPLALLLAIVVAAAGSYAAWRAVRETQWEAAQCPALTELNVDRHDDVPVTTGTRNVVVLGDSYSQGVQLSQPRDQAWSTVLGHETGWTVRVDAMGQTGFVNGGYCGGQQFSARLPRALAMTPDLLIVQGGLNDTDTPDQVGPAAQALLAAAAAVPDVVVIGPPAAPVKDGAAAPVDAALRDATEAAGRRYVSTADWPLPYLDDGLHLPAEGHRRFAELAAAALVEARPG